MSTIVEGTLIAALTAWTGITSLGTAISDADWLKIKGPEGALFLSVIIIVVLWNQGRIRERNEDKRREAEREATEKRHRETLEIQQRAADKNEKLVVECILSNGKVATAINSLDNSMKHLVNEILDPERRNDRAA
jgi:hypothetical protein